MKKILFFVFLVQLFSVINLHAMGQDRYEDDNEEGYAVECHLFDGSAEVDTTTGSWKGAALSGLPDRPHSTDIAMLIDDENSCSGSVKFEDAEENNTNDSMDVAVHPGYWIDSSRDEKNQKAREMRRETVSLVDRDLVVYRHSKSSSANSSLLTTFNKLTFQHIKGDEQENEIVCAQPLISRKRPYSELN